MNAKSHWIRIFRADSRLILLISDRLRKSAAISPAHAFRKLVCVAIDKPFLKV
jgi:hypothetical protein